MVGAGKRGSKWITTSALALVGAGGVVGTAFQCRNLHQTPSTTTVASQSLEAAQGSACSQEASALTQAEERLESARKKDSARTSSSLDELRAGTGVLSFSYVVARQRALLQACQDTHLRGP